VAAPAFVFENQQNENVDGPNKQIRALKKKRWLCETNPNYICSI